MTVPPLCSKTFIHPCYYFYPVSCFTFPSIIKALSVILRSYWRVRGKIFFGYSIFFSCFYLNAWKASLWPVLQIDFDMHYFSIKVLITVKVYYGSWDFLFSTFKISPVSPFLVDADWACAVLGNEFCQCCRPGRRSCKGVLDDFWGLKTGRAFLPIYDVMCNFLDVAPREKLLFLLLWGL